MQESAEIEMCTLSAFHLRGSHLLCPLHDANYSRVSRDDWGIHFVSALLTWANC